MADSQRLLLFKQAAKQQGFSDDEINQEIMRRTLSDIGNKKSKPKEKDKEDKNFFERLAAPVENFLRFGGEATAQGLRAAVDPNISFANPLAKQQKFKVDETNEQITSLNKRSRDLILKARATDDPEEKKRLLDESRSLGVEIESKGKEAGKVGESQKSFFVNEEKIKDREAVAKTGAKRTIGAASLAVPGGTTLKSAAALGGLAGIGLGFAEDEEEFFNVGDIVMGAGGGAVGGAIGFGLGKLFNKITSKGGKLSTERTQGLRKSIVKPQTGTKPLDVLKEEEIVESLAKKGIKGSAQNQRKQIAEATVAGRKALKKVLTKSKFTKPTAEIIEGLNERYGKAAQIVDTDTTVIKAKSIVEGILTNVANKGDDGLNYSASQINEAKRAIPDIDKIFTKIKKGIDLTPAQDVYIAAYGFLDDTLKSGVKQVKPILKDLHLFQLASPGLKKSAQKGTRVPFVGTFESVTAPLQAAKSKAAAVTSKTGEVLTKTSQLQLPKLPGTSAGAAEQVGRIIGSQDRTPPETGVSTLEFEQPQTPQTKQAPTSPGGEWTWDFQANDWVPTNQVGGGDAGGGALPTPQEFAQAAINDLQNNGGKNIAKIKAAADLAKAAQQKGTDLDADQEKGLRKLSTAEGLMDMTFKMAVEFNNSNIGWEARLSGAGRTLMANLGHDPNVKTFNDLRDGTRSLIARTFGEVGNLSEPEQQNALKLMPDAGDTPVELETKYNALKYLLNRVRSGIIETPTEGTPFIPEFAQ